MFVQKMKSRSLGNIIYAKLFILRVVSTNFFVVIFGVILRSLAVTLKKKCTLYFNGMSKYNNSL